MNESALGCLLHWQISMIPCHNVNTLFAGTDKKPWKYMLLTDKEITRHIKSHLPDYKAIEKRLQDTIYNKFLGSPLTEDEEARVEEIDHDILVCEFSALMKKKVFGFPTLHFHTQSRDGISLHFCLSCKRKTSTAIL
jgi:hypothetical protein